MTIPTVSSGTPTQSAWANQVAAEVNGLIPVGTVWMWPTAAPPAGWLLCNGQEVARTGTYQALFDLIGTSYGAGNTTTTFNVPNFSNRFPVGTGSNPAVSLGGTGGSKDATLVTHSHTVNAHTHGFTTGNELSSLSHWHGLEDHKHNYDHWHLAEIASSQNGWAQGSHDHYAGVGSVAEGPRATGGTVGTPGKSVPVNVTGTGAGGTGGAGWHGGAQSAGPAVHQHNGTTGGASDSATNSQGASATNANLPPYLGINFIIKY